MKCNFYISEDSSMSSNAGRYSLKFRILALVVNTANLINERATQTLSISHAILAPIAFITTYIFLGVMAAGACQERYASDFLQIYSLVACCSLQTSLSILVFTDLKNRKARVTDRDVGIVLNAVLPMFTIMLIVADLIIILFSKRDDMTLPSTRSDAGSSQTHSIRLMSNQNRHIEKPNASTPGSDPRTLRIAESATQPAAPSRSLTTSPSEEPTNPAKERTQSENLNK